MSKPTTVSPKQHGVRSWREQWYEIILPTYIIALPIFEGGRSAQRLAVIRAIRLLRQVCPECMAEGHDADAVHCKYCGVKL